MIYVTADLHGDATRLHTKEIRRLKKGDTLIVLGDFGFLWQGTPKEKKLFENCKCKLDTCTVEIS